MARIDTLGNFLTDVADAIREKGGTSEPIQASDFDTEIANLPSGGGLDWTAIGYESMPQSIIDGYNYAKQIQNNWDATASLRERFYENYQLSIMPLVDTSIGGSATDMFNSCRGLISIPLLDFSNVTTLQTTFANCINLDNIPLLNTENVTNFSSTFSGCTNLKTLATLNTEKVTNFSGTFTSCLKLETAPPFNTSNCTRFSTMYSNCMSLKNVPIYNTSKASGSNAFTNMFYNCPLLTTQSLDNILQTCINAVAYTSTKTLARLGLVADNYPAETIQSLPHYQAFINAGWTIGY